MRQDPERPDLLEADDADHAVGVHLEVERPRRVMPALAKAIAYKRDRRSIIGPPQRDRRI